MRRWFSSLLLISLFATSCDEVYRKWEKDAFANMAWRRGDELIFSPEIDDIATTYQLVVGVRHVFGADIPSLPLVVTMVAPSGRETVNGFTLQVTSPEGRTQASCAGDLCDLEVPVGELVFSEPGEYRFVITHNADREVIRGILEVGLILQKVD